MAKKPNDAAHIAKECGDCAEYYERAPGHVGPPATIDLYRVIARLARIIEKQQRQLDHLMPDKSDDD